MNKQNHALINTVGNVLVIKLNRPEKKNALSPDMLVRVYDAWRE